MKVTGRLYALVEAGVAPIGRQIAYPRYKIGFHSLLRKGVDPWLILGEPQFSRSGEGVGRKRSTLTGLIVNSLTVTRKRT